MATSPSPRSTAGGPRREISERGHGWAVRNADGVVLPGRWATEHDATEYGLAGRYLLSGLDVTLVKGP